MAVNTNLTSNLGDSTLHWTWVGKEVELDVSYLYLESFPIQGQGDTWHGHQHVFFQRVLATRSTRCTSQRGARPMGQAMERREMLNWEWPTFVGKVP